MTNKVLGKQSTDNQEIYIYHLVVKSIPFTDKLNTSCRFIELLSKHPHVQSVLKVIFVSCWLSIMQRGLTVLTL